MATISTPADVRALWLGSNPLPKDEIIDAWLEKAEILIASEVEDFDTRLDDDTDGAFTQKVIFVAVQAVMRIFRNPDGVRQKSNTAGSFSEQITWGTETIRQPLVIEPEELAMLTGRETSHYRATGVDMIAEQPTTPDLYHAWVNGPTGQAPGGR